MHLKHIKSGIWHLVGRKKKQKGGFLPILGALARPLLASAAALLVENFECRRRRRVKRFSYA